MAFSITMPGDPAACCVIAHRRRGADAVQARSAAKLALRQELNHALGLSELEVNIDSLVISFSHLPGETWAAATTTPCFLGIDAARDEEFTEPYPLHKAFYPEELAGGRSPACIWTMKEAAVKALGCGFERLNPLDVVIRAEAGLAWIYSDGGFSLHIWSQRRDACTWIAVAYAGLTELALEKRRKINSLHGITFK